MGHIAAEEGKGLSQNVLSLPVEEIRDLDDAKSNRVLVRAAGGI
jgi:hypothetical protein